MITRRHIEIYAKYSGNSDGFIRCATHEEKAILDYKHWSLIDNFVQDISMIRKGLVTDSFMKSVDLRLSASCDTEETMQELKRLEMFL